MAAIAQRRPSAGGVRSTLMALVVAVAVVVPAIYLRSPAVVLVVLAAFAALYWLSVRPRVALVLLAGLGPAFGGLARGVPVPGLRISEVVTVAASIALLLWYSRDQRLRFDWIDAVIGSFAVCNIVLASLSALAGGQYVGISSVFGLAAPAEYFLAFLAARRVATLPAFRSLTFAALAGGFMLNGIAAGIDRVSPAAANLFQSMTIGGEATFTRYGETARASGIFAHPQVLAGYLSLGVVFLVCWLASDRALSPRMRRFAAFCLVCAAGGLALTVVLAAMILVPAASLYVVWNHRRAWFAPSVAALVLALLAASPLLVSRVSEQTGVSAGTASANRSPLVPETVAFRWDVWTTQSIPSLSGRWWTGVGLDVPSTVQWKSAESMYFLLIFRGGLPLLAVFLATLLTAQRLAAGRVRAGSGDPAALFCSVFIPVLLLMFLIQPYLNYGGIGQAFWLLVGLGVAVPRRSVAFAKRFRVRSLTRRAIPTSSA